MRLSDIIKHTKKFFEKKRKNPIQLENDSNLESNLKFLKVSDKSTPLQISDDTINVQGSLTVNGTSVSTEPDDDTAAPITALNDATANELVTVGSTTTELDAEANLTFDGQTLEIINDSALTKAFKIAYDGSNYALFDVNGQGTLTIQTIGSAPDINIHAAGGCINFKTGAGTFGEFQMNSTNLKLLASQGYSLTLETTDAGGEAQDITLDSSKDIVLDAAADIVLDSGSGDFIAKKGGTEFSAANSAYAGMILGYTCVGADVARDSYTLTTSYVCFDDSGGTPIRVSFVTPPSENVEIEVELNFSSGSGASDLELSLSNNATYGSNSLIHPNQFEKVVQTPARGNGGTVTQKWYFGDGNLSAIGSVNHLYIAARCDSTSGTPIIGWGGDATGEYTNLVLKATALPETIAVGS